jgi:hypothetical protein
MPCNCANTTKSATDLPNCRQCQQKSVHKWKRECTLQEETKILERFETIQLKIKEFHVLCEQNHNNEIAQRKLTYFCKKLEKIKEYYLEDDGSDFHGPT